MINVFISYSYTSTSHEDWVTHLANDLERDPDINVTYDKYDIDGLDDKNHYMEKSINQCSLLLIVCEKGYKEKADKRAGGVGIETRLAVPNYHRDMQNNGRSNCIVIKRDSDNCIPAYLENQLHIDFHNDNNYQSALSQLKKQIKGHSKIERPKKEDSNWEDSLELKNIENIISECAKNRKLIHAGIDRAKKVKYEVWEILNPDPSYIFALHHNINITNTIQNIDDYLKQNSHISNITILRTRPPREQKSTILNSRIKANELTYKDYLWSYGIDSALKEKQTINKIKYYTQQDVQLFNGEKERNAAQYISQQIKINSHHIAHLILADGGMGKTSLCRAISEEINSTQADGLVILISADSIRKYITRMGSDRLNIKTIYDLYNLQQSHYNENSSFTRSTFELAAITGNITIILDGFDEIESFLSISVFDFFESISEMHSQLGSSQIIITSRNNEIISDTQAKDLNIAKYKLLGFTIENCQSYLRTRFKERDDRDKISEFLISQIEQSEINEKEDNRIIPFFIDILANEIEKYDSFDSTQFIQASETIPYPNKGKFVDYLIFSVFRREKTRQAIEGVTLDDMMEIFIEACANMGGKWDINKLNENLEIMFDTKAEKIIKSLKIHPLINYAEKIGVLELKYEFLHDYFKFIYIAKNIDLKSIEPTFLSTLSSLSDDQISTKELAEYYNKKEDKLSQSIKSIINKEKSNKSSANSNQAIAVIVSIINNSVGTTEALTRIIAETFGTEYNGRTTIKNLHIYSDIKPIDFTDKYVTDSSFVNYKKFIKSKFENSIFSYCKFQDCTPASPWNTSLTSDNIEVGTCEIGDLKDVLEYIENEKTISRDLVEKEATFFLESFMRGLHFRDNNKPHIRFSGKIKGLHKNNFGKLVSKGFITIAVEKEVDTFYEISENFKESVRKFLNDASIDQKLEDFLTFISK